MSQGLPGEAGGGAGGLCQANGAGALHAHFEREWGSREQERKAGESTEGRVATVSGRAWGKGLVGSTVSPVPSQTLRKSAFSISALGVGTPFIREAGTGLEAVRGRAGTVLCGPLTGRPRDKPVKSREGSSRV